jgi:hypothetical protein
MVVVVPGGVVVVPAGVVVDPGGIMFIIGSSELFQ